MSRKPNIFDKLCEKCGTPMIGIMKVSDLYDMGAPRKLCVNCKKGKKS